LSGKSLENEVKGLYNRNCIYIRQKEYSSNLARRLVVDGKIELLPVVDEDGKVAGFTTWDELFSEGGARPFKVSDIDIPVVIMAGGRGTRLEPFTRVLPKPLIPVGDRPVVEIIISEFKKHGINRFYITLNHKTNMVESYLNSIEKDYDVEYVKEDDFLGTAGSLKLLEADIDETFIVSNCDVIVNADFADVVKFHRKHEAYLTILASVKHYNIPYGVIEFKRGGEVESVLEKPEYTFTINTGVYVVEKKALGFMPGGAAFDMIELIEVLRKKGGKVVLYPVNESDYTDIGQWEEYKKTIEKISMLR